MLFPGGISCILLPEGLLVSPAIFWAAPLCVTFLEPGFFQLLESLSSPLAVPGTTLHFGLKAKETSVSSPAPFHPQDAVGAGEPSASLALSSLIGVPSRFLTMAGAASFTTTNLQVFKHLHGLTLPYMQSFGSFPNPCPSNHILTPAPAMVWPGGLIPCMCWDHLDLVACPTNLPLPLQPHKVYASCDDLYKINWIPIMVIRCPHEQLTKSCSPAQPAPNPTGEAQEPQEWMEKGTSQQSMSRSRSQGQASPKFLL